MSHSENDEKKKPVISIDISGATGSGKSTIALIIKEALERHAIKHDIHGEIETDHSRVISLHENVSVDVNQYNVVTKHVFLDVGNSHMSNEEVMPILREYDFTVVKAYLSFHVSNMNSPKTVDLKIEASDHLRSVFAVHGHELYEVPYGGPGTMMRLVLDHTTGFIEQRIGEDCYFGLSSRWNLYIKLERRFKEQ